MVGCSGTFFVEADESDIGEIFAQVSLSSIVLEQILYTIRGMIANNAIIKFTGGGRGGRGVCGRGGEVDEKKKENNAA